MSRSLGWSVATTQAITIKNMSEYNQNSGYGQALLNMVANQVPVFGRLLIVVSTSDTALEYYQRLQAVFPPDPSGRVRFFTSLSDAYTEAYTNNNDVILLSSYSTHTLTSGLAVSKNRIHFLGMDGGDRLQAQGVRVQLATAATTAYVMRNTGNRNTFRNIKFIQAATAGTGLNVVEEGGEGTLYKNCSFTFGVVDNLGGTTAHELVCGSDSATYLNCTFGAATLTTSGARTVCLYDGVTGGATTPRDNVFKECIFTIESSAAGAQFVSMTASGDAKGINLFQDCDFVAAKVNGGGIALTKAVSTANGLTDGVFCYAYPRAFNCTDFATNGTNNDNIQVVAPVSVAAAIEGIAPTA